MAYRRRLGLSRSSTFKEEILRQPDQDDDSRKSSTAPSSPLATQGNKASDPRLNSFRSSSGTLHGSFKNRTKLGCAEKQSSATYDYTSMKSTNESGGFWCVLARKAKSILEKETPQQSNGRNQFNGIQLEHSKKMDSLPRLRITSTLNQIGETIGNALEEDKKNEENRKAQQNIYKEEKIEDMDEETQLKASRDVAIATAAKAKILLRELKTVKADLQYAVERCRDLEEENKVLREEGDHPANDDDDMIREQLEMLMAEKGRLAHENSVYARENRLLREIVEYHQLTMQDVVMYWEDDVIQDVDIETVLSTLPSASSSPPPETSQHPPPPPPLTTSTTP